MDGRLQHSCENITYVSNQSRIEQLPHDVLLLILSYSCKNSLRDVACTSVLSRRWKNLWHNITCLDFNASTLLPKDRLTNSHAWYIDWVNSVIKARLAIPHLPFVKKFRIRYSLYEIQRQHIDSWIDFAIANQVETLHLELSGYNSLNYFSQYKLSEESWNIAHTGLASLKCLKVLFLSCVSVSKQFIEFILSSCPLLEDLTLRFSGNFKDLDVSGVPPLRLRRLNIDTCGVKLAKICAPYLMSLFINLSGFNPQKIDVPMLTNLTIGSRSYSKPIEKYLEHFWPYLPQLEKLELIMLKEQKFYFLQMPKLTKLKYLKIQVGWDIDIAFSRIIKFIGACPLLETFALQIYRACVIPHRLLNKAYVREEKRKVENSIGSFKCLKVLELYGGEGKSLDQEVIKFIISKSRNLEKVLVSLSIPMRYPHDSGHKQKIVKAVQAKAKKLCKENGLKTKITVVKCSFDDSFS